MAKLYVILGSTRQQRLGERVTTWVMQAADQLMPGQVELVDLRELAISWYDELKTPDELAGRYSDPAAQRWHDTIVQAERLLFITPEYNHSYPGVLKNAIDYMFSQWQGKRYALISYSIGAIGGARAAQQLRGLLDYIGLICHGEINIPFADKTIAQNGTVIDTQLSPRLKKIITALLA